MALKGCASDANCPLDRPLCGAGPIDSSGNDHMCGCFLDSDCDELGATLGPGLTAICEDRVCVEGCR